VSEKTRKWIQDVWGIDFYSLEEIAEPPPTPPYSSYPEPIIQLGKGIFDGAFSNNSKPDV
jgi:hypothetical protein